MCFASTPKIKEVPLPPNIQNYDPANDITAARENDAKRRRAAASRANSILAGTDARKKTLFGD